MPSTFRRHLLTIVSSAILVVSMAIMALGSAGVVPTGNTWRVLIIPAYLPMLASAILATSLSLPNAPFLWLVSIAGTILPFVALDWLRARLARRHTPAA